MSETSRQFWRDPYKYSRNQAERHFGSPEHYIGEHCMGISENILRILATVEADKEWRVLEIGCNVGRNLHHFYNAGYKNIHGVEINPRAVEKAWEVFPHIAGTMTVSDAQSFLAMQPPGSFDLIFTQSVLMHIPPEDDYLFGQMARVAKRMILTCEIEMNNKGHLIRHKWNRKYDDVFMQLGWTPIYEGKEKRRTLRVLTK